MDEQNSLLPPNAGRATRALEIDRITGLTDEVGRGGDPDAIRLDRLPWLAWGLNVDAWLDSWPEEVKRASVRDAILYHGKKGTIAGFRAAARLAGGEVMRVVDPRSRTFLAPSLTVEEREAFLERYPELRVYRYRDTGAAGFGLFPGRLAFCGGVRHPSDTGARGRWGEQAYVYRDGEEVPLTTATEYLDTEEGLAVDYTEVRDPGRALGVFPGALAARRHLVAHGAGARIYRLRIAQRFVAPVHRVTYTTVRPSLEPLGYDAAPVAVRGQRRGVFAGGSLLGAEYLVRSDAEARLYSSLRLFDPSIPIESRGRSTHLGGARLRMTPYTAEIRLRLRGRRSLRAQSRFVFGAFVAGDRQPYDDALRIMAWAKSARDHVLITTTTSRQIVAGISHIAGEAVAGQFEELT